MRAANEDHGVPALRVEVLGPLRLLVDGSVVEVRGERRTAVLALVALAGGRVVPFDTLIDSVWEEEPPEGARQALHSLLSRLRTQLGAHPDRFERDGSGYRLRLEAGELEPHTAGATADGCRASCVDWYGNARPLFLRGRPFALLGYELVEGRLDGGRIVERRRASFAPGVASVSR